MKKRKDGRYCKKLTINGKQKAFYGETQSEVYYKIRMFEEKQKQGRTFSEVADEWEEDHEKKVVFSSMAVYYPGVKRAKKYFGDTPIKDITPSKINAFMMSFCELQPARKTAYHQLAVIRMICKHAIINGDIETNPAQYVDVPSGLKKEKRSLPSDKELELIKENVDLPFGLFAYFILFTGLRRGEALALNYEDINFTDNTIEVSKSLAYNHSKPYLKEPKTENGKRIVPLLDPLKDKLNQKNTGLIFPGSRGGFMPESQYVRRWTAYQNQSGVSCTAHQIRHAYATIIFEAGISAKDAQSLLGHADIMTTNNIYTHIRESKRKDTAKKLNDFVKR